MATLLHDAVMNPAEGNVPGSEGVAVGTSEGREVVVGGGQKVWQGDSSPPRQNEQ